MRDIATHIDAIWLCLSGTDLSVGRISNPLFEGFR